MRNKFPGSCYRCGGTVVAGSGHFEKIPMGGWRTIHSWCVREQRAEKEEAVMAKAKVTREEKDFVRRAMLNGGVAESGVKTVTVPFAATKAPAEPVLGLPDVLERLALHERRAAVAREACAGTRVIEAAARDAAGLGWEFHPYAPDSRAERVGRGWEGWFTVGGKRMLVRIDLEEREPSAAEAEALAEVEKAGDDLAAAEEQRDEAVKEADEAEKERDAAVERREAWEDTVQAALDGDGPGAVAAAAKIKAEDRP